MTVTLHKNILESAGNLYLYVGQHTGYEAAIHSPSPITQSIWLAKTLNCVVQYTNYLSNNHDISYQILYHQVRLFNSGSMKLYQARELCNAAGMIIYASGSSFSLIVVVPPQNINHAA